MVHPMAPFDLDACIEQLLRKQLLHEALLREICEKTKEILMRESNVVHVSAPVTVVGDIHGYARALAQFPAVSPRSRQFYDLLEIFRIGGYAPNTNYLFLGASRLAHPCGHTHDYNSALQAIMWTVASSASKLSRSSHVSSCATPIECS